MIVADTSGLLAFFNLTEPAHEPVREFIESSEDVLVVSPFVVAELDYLLATRVGVEAELAVMRELSSGAYLLASLDGRDIRAAAEVIDKYRDQGIGVADASLVVLADRYGTRTILTLDRRPFDVIRPVSGGRFKVVP